MMLAVKPTGSQSGQILSLSRLNYHTGQQALVLHVLLLEWAKN